MTSPENREILQRLTKLEQYFKMRGDRLEEMEQDLIEIQNNQDDFKTLDERLYGVEEFIEALKLLGNSDDES